MINLAGARESVLELKNRVAIRVPKTNAQTQIITLKKIIRYF
jgi:hypothetical protein